MARWRAPMDCRAASKQENYRKKIMSKNICQGIDERKSEHTRKVVILIRSAEGNVVCEENKGLLQPMHHMMRYYRTSAAIAGIIMFCRSI